jgi:hypothetical protein
MNFLAFYGAKITIYFVVKKLLPKSRAISSGFVRDFLRICAQFPPESRVISAKIAREFSANCS